LDPDGHATLAKIALRLADRVPAEMEDRGDERRIRHAFGHALSQVLQRAGPTRGDDGHGDGLRDGAGEIEIVAVSGSVLVHARQENFPRPEILHFPGPREGVEAGRPPAAMRVDTPSQAIARGLALGVDRDDDALAAERAGG